MAKRKGKRGSPYIKPLDASIHPLAHLFISMTKLIDEMHPQIHDSIFA